MSKKNKNKNLQKSLPYRYIVELSHMSNNDEYVFYSDKPVEWEDIWKNPKYLRSGFDQPTLVFCRQLQQSELDEGLQPKNGIPLREEKSPEITTILDGLQSVLSSIQGSFLAFQKYDPKDTTVRMKELVVRHISDHFYDCMSVGMPTWGLFACRRLVKLFDVSRETEVYPKGSMEEWYTIADFMKETDYLEEKIMASKKEKADLLLSSTFTA